MSHFVVPPSGPPTVPPDFFAPGRFPAGVPLAALCNAYWFTSRTTGPLLVDLVLTARSTPETVRRIETMLSGVVGLAKIAQPFRLPWIRDARAFELMSAGILRHERNGNSAGISSAIYETAALADPACRAILADFLQKRFRADPLRCRELFTAFETDGADRAHEIFASILDEPRPPSRGGKSRLILQGPPVKQQIKWTRLQQSRALHFRTTGGTDWPDTG